MESMQHGDPFQSRLGKTPPKSDEHKKGRAIRGVIGGVVGVAILAIGIVRGLTDPAPSSGGGRASFGPLAVMSNELGDLYERKYREAEAAFARDEYFEPGAYYIRETINILERHEPTLRGEEQLVVRAAAQFLRANLAYHDAYADLLEAFDREDGFDPISLKEPDQARKHINRIHVIRTALVDVQNRVANTEYDYYQAMIAHGVSQREAVEEARDFVRRSRMNIVTEIYNVEAAIIAELESQFNLLLSHWGRWKAPEGLDEVWFYNDEALSAYNAGVDRLTGLEAQMKSLNRRLYSRDGN